VVIELATCVAPRVMPGRFKPSALTPAGTTGWVVRSATLNGVEVIDTGFDVRPGESVAGLALLYTDARASSAARCRIRPALRRTISSCFSDEQGAVALDGASHSTSAAGH